MARCVKKLFLRQREVTEATLLPNFWDEKIDSPQGRMYAHRMVEKSGPNIVFVHGWMMNAHIWDPIREILGDANVLAPHLPGAHDSSPDGPFDLAGMASSLIAACDEAGIEEAIWVGHSMGGQIVQWLAAHHPEHVQGQILLCPVPAAGLPLPPEAMELFAGSATNRELQGTILDMATIDLPEGGKERLLRIGAEPSEANIGETLKTWTAGGFADALANILCPTVCVASDDPFLPPDFLQAAVVDPIAKASLVHLPGAGHYLPTERPAETAAIIQSFIAGLSA